MTRRSIVGAAGIVMRPVKLVFVVMEELEGFVVDPRDAVVSEKGRKISASKVRDSLDRVGSAGATTRELTR